MMTQKTDSLNEMDIELGKGFVLFSPSLRQRSEAITAELSELFAELSGKYANRINVQNVD